MMFRPKIISSDSMADHTGNVQPVPLVVVLGLPSGDFYEQWAQRWMGEKLGHKALFLAPPVLDDPGTDECPQCTLLQKTLSRLETALKNHPGRLDGIFLEAPVELDPRKLIQALAEIPGIRLDAVTSWIDASRFFHDFSSEQDWHDRLLWGANGVSAATLYEPVLETWIDQLEFCDAHVLVGLRDLPPKERESIMLILKALQPEAIQIEAERVDDWVGGLFSWNLFNFERAFNACAWKKILNEAQRSSPHYFKSKRPFHPVRLNTLIENWPEDILRSFGTVWLASHNDMALALSQAGPAGFFISPEGYWIGSLSAEERCFALDEHPELSRDWDPKFGDRVTELAFVSLDALTPDWTKRLDACLLTDIEMRMDWGKFQNPFPTFEDPDEVTTTLPAPLSKKAHLAVLRRCITYSYAQFWFWGQDLEHRKAKTFIAYGFKRFPPPPGVYGRSMYLLELSPQRFLCLWPFHRGIRKSGGIRPKRVVSFTINSRHRQCDAHGAHHPRKPSIEPRQARPLRDQALVELPA